MLKLLGIGKSKRKQRCLVLTEDGRIVEEHLPVIKGYVVSEKTGEAWELYPAICIPERGTNNLIQVLTERDYAPMPLNGNDKSLNKRLKTQNIQKIAQENASAARAKIQKKSYKNKQAETLQILAIILCITIGIVVIFGLFLSGKIHFPWSSGGGVFSSLALGVMLPRGELRRLKKLSESHVKEGKGTSTRKREKTPVIFAVPDVETGTGYHEVLYAEDGDLNHGKRKRFRQWDKATKFARKKHKEMGGELILHPY